MKSKLFLFLVLVAMTLNTEAQQKTAWENWNGLMGNWIGEGSGEPGSGGGTFSFSPDLDQNILVRKSHSVYPASGNKPEIIHDDLMIIYKDFSENTSRAIYFDNEGHTINYQIEYLEKSIVLTSEKIANVPVFRLTYTMLEAGLVNTKFEISQDGTNFMTYIEGKSKKINKLGE